jgi:hypothetical protein
MAKKFAACRLGSDPTSLAGASHRKDPGASAKHGRILPMSGLSTSAPTRSLITSAAPNATSSGIRRSRPSAQIAATIATPTRTPNQCAERTTETRSSSGPPPAFSARNTSSSACVW